MTSLDRQFHDSWTTEAATRESRLLPTALAIACQQVLAVDGAAIVLVDDQQWPVPIGASTTQAAAAERWQFTLGEGPCPRVWTSGQALVADERQLSSTWPALHDEICRHTPYRALAALPLQDGPVRLGVLVLYFHTLPSGSAFNLDAAQVVASLTCAELLVSAARAETTEAAAASAVADRFDWTPDNVFDQHGPDWLDTPTAQRRQEVHAAVALTTQTLPASDADALALLRAHAYTQEATLEEVTGDIVHGRVTVRDLQDPDG